MLDALGLCIGDRADARTVRPGARRADITAIFDVGALQPVMAWLAQRDLELPDNECILRRVIGADGRSKAFINGTPATLADCTAVGALLVDIHSQHAHQSRCAGATNGRCSMRRQMRTVWSPRWQHWRWIGRPCRKKSNRLLTRPRPIPHAWTCFATRSRN